MSSVAPKLSKSEKRQQLRASKEKVRLEKKAVHLSQIALAKEVTQAERPKLEKKVTSEKIGSRLDMRMEYARDLEDREDEWSWRVKRDWGDAFWTTTLEPYLNHYATKVWKEIEAELAGRSKRHKSYLTAAICSEAYARLRKLKLDDQERIFRFRMTGPHRLYGFRFGHVFKTVWFDPTHQIYPTKK